MALVAHLFRDRFVDFVRQERAVIRAVRIVAGGATLQLDRIVHVPRLESAAVGLVTFQAEIRLSGLEEPGAVCRVSRLISG